MIQWDDVFTGHNFFAFLAMVVGNMFMFGVVTVNCGGKKGEKAPASAAGPAPGAPPAGGAPPPAAGGAPAPPAGGAPPGGASPGNPGAGSADVNVGPQSVHAFTAAAPPTPA